MQGLFQVGAAAAALAASCCVELYREQRNGALRVQPSLLSLAAQDSLVEKHDYGWHLQKLGHVCKIIDIVKGSGYGAVVWKNVTTHMISNDGFISSAEWGYLVKAGA